MDGQEYNMDVDLFGESELPPPPIAVPPVKGLARRLDELSSSGCCQKIAWSKNGCVAYITPDGYGINLRVFARDPSTGKWALGKDCPIDVRHDQDEHPFVHLSWNGLGNDLAVINAAGHVMIFACNLALDRMNLMRADQARPEAELDAVVGFHWLAIIPHEQKTLVAWSASGKGDRWNFHYGSHIFKDAHHPAESKASLIYLKRQGELRLRFQQPDNSWHEAAATLGPMVSTREPFTHGAFASNNDNTLLLAAYDVSCRLHLYRIEARWNIPTHKQGQPPKFYEKPEIIVSQLHVEDNCYPTSSPSVNGDPNNTSEPRIRIPAQLTHLNFLPTTPDQSADTFPTIQAIFSTPPNLVSFDQTQPQQSPFSILVSWEVHHAQQNRLHSSLDKVTSKKKSVSSVPARDVFILKRLPETVMHAAILYFSPLWLNMILAFYYSDGTIEFRKRSTMEIMAPDHNTETVTSLMQAGFTFPAHDPSLHISLSPNNCMAACMQQDGVIKVRSMEYAHGSLSSEEEDPRHSAALAALILQYSSAANQYFTNDDILAIMGELTEKRKQDFIYLMFQGLNVNIDCGVDESTNNHLILLGRTPYLVKTLSAAHVLGLGSGNARSVTSKISWMILNIKYITQVLTTIARMHGSLDKTPVRPEVVPQFIGICRWIHHFIVYVVDELMAVGYEVKDLPQNSFDRPTLEAKIHELNQPAIIILLSSFPRMMMKLWVNPLVWVAKSADNFVNRAPSPEVRRIYTPLHQAINEAPFDFRLFEALISEAQALVRNSYKRAAIKDDQRNEIERQLILGNIDEVLVPAARRLLTDTLFKEEQPNGALLDKFDIPKVMFFDTTWLGLSDSRPSKKWFETHVVDVCQKLIIRGTGAQVSPPHAPARKRSDSAATGAGAMDGRKRKGMLRQCVRCGAYMEDVTQGLPGYGSVHVSWLMGVAKHCICGGSWMLVAEKKR